IRYAPLVKARGGMVVVECQSTLVPLLQTCAGIDELVPRDAALPAFAVHAPLMSLPGIFGTVLDTIPAGGPYLRAAPERVEHWRRQLAATRGVKIGIVWQGSPGYRWDRQRSLPLRTFEHLARVPGVHLFSLQRGQGVDQLASIGDRFAVTDLGNKLEEASQAFVERAAVIANLDLVISCDTAIAHLAGALGAPVWVAHSIGSDWRWLTDREDSPWYPTMRLFRQTRAGDWDEVLERMAVALATRPMRVGLDESMSPRPPAG